MPGSNGRSALSSARADRLVAELIAARAELLALLDAVDPSRMTAPGLVGEWSASELIAHVGYWAGHAVEVLHAAERGITELVGEGQPPVDEINATVARVARESDTAAVITRERAAFEFLVERLTGIEPQLLDLLLSDGATVEQGIREDGSEHYREHASQLREALSR